MELIVGNVTSPDDFEIEGNTWNFMDAFEATLRRRPEVDEVQSRSFLRDWIELSMDVNDRFGKHERDMKIDR